MEYGYPTLARSFPLFNLSNGGLAQIFETLDRDRSLRKCTPHRVCQNFKLCQPLENPHFPSPHCRSHGGKRNRSDTKSRRPGRVTHPNIENLSIFDIYRTILLWNRTTAEEIVKASCARKYCGFVIDERRNRGRRGKVLCLHFNGKSTGILQIMVPSELNWSIHPFFWFGRRIIHSTSSVPISVKVPSSHVLFPPLKMLQIGYNCVELMPVKRFRDFLWSMA